MDVHGAVDLSLPVTVLHGPASLDEPTHTMLLGLGELQLELAPKVWLESQLVRLALASVIEARLLHVREQRLAGFSLSRDPEAVTLRQLAALWRAHSGAAGQAFELAVVEAVNHGVPEVVDPIVEALRLLDIHDSQPPRMMVIGLEKVPADQREAAAASIAAAIPHGAGLRTGQRGRPAGPRTVATRMTEACWADMSGGASDLVSVGEASLLGLDEAGKTGTHYTEQSQLARADALLYTERVMVGVSLKINPKAMSDASARHGWRDVPLWITRGPRYSPGSRVYAQPGATVPMVVVELADNRWTRCFETALNILEAVLLRVDRGRAPGPGAGVAFPTPGSPSAEVAQRLVKHADQPIASITGMLRHVHPSVDRSVSSRILAGPWEMSLPAVDNPAVLSAWEAEGAGGGIYKGPHHLFFRGDKPAA